MKILCEIDRKNLRFTAVASAIVLLAVLGIVLRLTIKSDTLKFATTTSVYDTGLLQDLIEEWRATSPNGMNYEIFPSGSGTAVGHANEGMVDCLLVHSPGLEAEMVLSGNAVNRTTLFYNYFEIAGHPADPANIAVAASPGEAFESIRTAGRLSQATFISRGDNSGTHIRELGIWASLVYSDGPEPTPETEAWYVEVDAGMGVTIALAADVSDGYVLTDLGTLLTTQEDGTAGSLVNLYTGDSSLYNPYSFLAVNPEVHPHVKYDTCVDFLRFLRSPEAREIVEALVIADTPVFNWFE